MCVSCTNNIIKYVLLLVSQAENHKSFEGEKDVKRATAYIYLAERYRNALTPKT